MTKRIAISQSNYIPWKGYFDFINSVDEFVLYDDVQYTRRDWRNRNRIKTPHGLKWLTISVSADYHQKINEVEIADGDWNEQHWKRLRHLYNKADYFDSYSKAIEQLYKTADQKKLCEINYHFISGINKLLDIKTKLIKSTEFVYVEGKTERLVSICKQAEADVYVTGPAAEDYLNTRLFKKNNIRIEWMNYDGYPEYPQLYGAFEHSVSILDLLFNTGNEVGRYMKSINNRERNITNPGLSPIN